MRTSSRDRWAASPAMIAIRQEILRAYHEVGPLTDATLERHPLFVRRRFGYSTLRSRRGELVALGLVRQYDTTYDLNRDGRVMRMAVWGLTAQGRLLDPRMLPSYERRNRRQLVRQRLRSPGFSSLSQRCA
jgi:Ser/Thr protein kinase RdoA (MazF antagonist)